MSSALADIHGDRGALVGKVLNGLYELEKLIGEGGMGAVYSAKHVHLQKRFAVKVFRSPLAPGKAELERFRHEAIAASRIDHPHIIDVVNFDMTEDGSAFLVMELLKGQNLAEILANGPLPLARSLDIVFQVGDALDAAHARGIVHRDLKPENIFITEKNGKDLVKILDFGISKMRAEGEEQVRITRTGQLLGTPRYMAPEQALEDAEVDHRVDVYALGAILYEMICGEPPFEGRNYAQLIYQHASVEPTPPSQRQSASAVPQGVERAILRALEKRPEARFASVADMMDALRAETWEAGEPGTITNGLRGRPPRHPRRRAIVPLALAAAGAAAWVGWFFWSHSDSQGAVPAASGARGSGSAVRVKAQKQRPTGPASEDKKHGELQGAAQADTHQKAESRNMTGPYDPGAAAQREPGVDPSAVGLEPGQVRMRFVSQPQGAEVWVRRSLLGRTPLTALVPATGDDVRVRFRATGHREYVTSVRPEQGGEVNARLMRLQQSPKQGSKRAGPRRALPIKKEL